MSTVDGYMLQQKIKFLEICFFVSLMEIVGLSRSKSLQMRGKL
jgi:hypothetical protein